MPGRRSRMSASALSSRGVCRAISPARLPGSSATTPPPGGAGGRGGRGAIVETSGCPA